MAKKNSWRLAQIVASSLLMASPAIHSWWPVPVPLVASPNYQFYGCCQILVRFLRIRARVGREDCSGRQLLLILYCALHTTHVTLYTPKITLHSTLVTLYTPKITLHTTHVTLYTPHSRNYIAHYTCYTLHSLNYIAHYTCYTAIFTFYTPHVAQSIAQFTLHA